MHALAGSGQLSSAVVEAASAAPQCAMRDAAAKATPAELVAQDAICNHSFCVPADRAPSCAPEAASSGSRAAERWSTQG